jgi:hypothetical protein
MPGLAAKEDTNRMNRLGRKITMNQRLGMKNKGYNG